MTFTSTKFRTVAGTITFAVMLACPCAGVVVKGRVMLDQNGDGLPDNNDTGVPGVLVSDGVSVTKTDAKGDYRIESAADRTLIHISTPRDRSVEGSFWRWSDGSREEIFLLTKSPQPDSFFWVQMTDSHLGRVDLFKKFMERLNSFPVPLAFAINTGDLVGGVDIKPLDKVKEQYDNYIEGISPFKGTLFNIPGNHEHASFQVKDADKSDPRYGKGTYRKLLGPTYYSWNWGPYHFLALDGTRLPYQEKLGEEQLAWLKEDLAATPVDTPLIVFCHQSLPALRDAKELMNVLKGRPVLAGFCGHLHETFMTKLGEIPVYQTGALSGSWWSGPNPDGSPQGFALVKLDGRNVHYCYSDREGTHSLCITKPSAAKLLSGTVPFEVTVLDYGQPVSVNACTGNTSLPVKKKGTGEFWSVWSGEMDTRLVTDGLTELEITAVVNDAKSSTSARFLTVNGNEAPFESTADAVVKMQVRGIDADDDVYFNGKKIGIIPAGTTNETLVEFAVPAEALKRANRLLIRAAAKPGEKDKDDFNVGSVWMQCGSKRIHDIRYVVFQRHQIGDDKPETYGPEKELFLCIP